MLSTLTQKIRVGPQTVSELHSVDVVTHPHLPCRSCLHFRTFKFLETDLAAFKPYTIIIHCLQPAVMSLCNIVLQRSLGQQLEPL